MTGGTLDILLMIGEILRIVADWVANFSFQPTEGLLGIASYSIYAMLFLFMAYAGIALGQLIYSLLLNFSDYKQPSRLHGKAARELLSGVTFKFWPGLFLGVFPLLTLGLCYATVFHGATGLVTVFYALAAGAMFAAVILMRLYSFTFPIRADLPWIHFGFGLLALVHFGGVIHMFVVASHLALNPEMWEWVYASLTQVIVAWNMIFFAKAFAMGGLALAALFWYFQHETPEHPDAKYELFLRRVTMGAALLFTLLLVPMFFLYIGTLQPFVASPAMFVFAALFLIVLFLAVRLILRALYTAGRRPAVGAFLLVLSALFFVVLTDQTARANASGDLTRLLVLRAREHHGGIMDARRQLAAEREGIVADGEQVFQESCSSCHAFDKAVVGPAYNDVLGKYEGNLEMLKGFIANPIKVDADFPPMPTPPITEPEIDAVARYLLTSYGGPDALGEPAVETAAEAATTVKEAEH